MTHRCYVRVSRCIRRRPVAHGSVAFVVFWCNRRFVSLIFRLFGSAIFGVATFSPSLTPYQTASPSAYSFGRREVVLLQLLLKRLLLTRQHRQVKKT